MQLLKIDILSFSYRFVLVYINGKDEAEFESGWEFQKEQFTGNPIGWSFWCF